MMPTVGTSVHPETQDKVSFKQTRTQFGMDIRIWSRSKERVEQERDKVLRNYPPAGYSTYFGVIKEYVDSTHKEDISWYVCYGHRLLSCD